MAQNTVYRVVSEINARIKKEICYETIKKLSEPNLMHEFTNCKSVKSLMNQEDSFLHTLLSECKLDNRKMIYLKKHYYKDTYRNVYHQAQKELFVATHLIRLSKKS